MYSHSLHKALALVLTAGFTLALSNAHASGFRLPEASTLGLGLSNAVVANPEELGALPYNPAAMSFHEGINLNAGLLFVDPNTEVNNATGNHSSNVDSPIIIPQFYLMDRLTPQWSVGLNVGAPFGLETNWSPETFPVFAGPLDPLEPTHSKLELVNINPNIAYRIGADTSIALGVDYYRVNEALLNTKSIGIRGDGEDWGWNIGLLHRAGPWSFGASYRSSVKVDIEGTLNASAVGSIASNARTSIEFPELWQVGARYRANEQLAVEFDIERMGWSSFDRLVIAHASPGITNPVVNVNDWSDSTAYRLGATYQLYPDLQLRAGYTFDETPQSGAHFTARIPDADRQTFSVGLAKQFQGWTLEGGYMYVLWDDRTINNSTPPAADPNGTLAFNGTYKSHAHLLGIGFSKKF
ncbi:MAG TPA: outer membrane protein transport protein [Gammaproteobacteria bacterium]|nr:outer membrane protein transport protein [Gammaproteobacteria bacterium]